MAGSIAARTQAHPRTLAWRSLAVPLVVCAIALLPVLLSLPFLSEPTGRAFTGEQPVPTAFFFLNLFAHVGLPLAMGVVFLLHVKRLARPVLLPPRPLRAGAASSCAAMAAARPRVSASAACGFPTGRRARSRSPTPQVRSVSQPRASPTSPRSPYRRSGWPPPRTPTRSYTTSDTPPRR